MISVPTRKVGAAVMVSFKNSGEKINPRRRFFRSVIVSAAFMVGWAIPFVAPMAETPVQLEANRKLVQDFWRVVIEGQDLDHIGDYYAPDIIQHNPNVANGIAGFIDFAKKRWTGQPKQSVEPTFRHPPAFVLADGDLVQLVFRHPTPDPSDPSKTYDRYSFDLYRVRNGKIVEHWDPIAKLAPTK